MDHDSTIPQWLSGSRTSPPEDPTRPSSQSLPEEPSSQAENESRSNSPFTSPGGSARGSPEPSQQGSLRFRRRKNDSDEDSDGSTISATSRGRAMIPIRARRNDKVKSSKRQNNAKLAALPTERSSPPTSRSRSRPLADEPLQLPSIPGDPNTDLKNYVQHDTVQSANVEAEPLSISGSKDVAVLAVQRELTNDTNVPTQSNTKELELQTNTQALKKLQTQLNESQSDNDDLIQKNKQQKNEIDKQQKEINMYKAKLKKQAEEHARRSNQDSNKLVNMEDHAKEDRDKIKKLQQDVKNLEEERKDARSRVPELEKECEGHRLKIAGLIAENAALLKVKEEQQRELDIEKQMCKDLEQQNANAARWIEKAHEQQQLLDREQIELYEELEEKLDSSKSTKFVATSFDAGYSSHQVLGDIIDNISPSVVLSPSDLIMRSRSGTYRNIPDPISRRATEHHQHFPYTLPSRAGTRDSLAALQPILQALSSARTSVVLHSDHRNSAVRDVGVQTEESWNETTQHFPEPAPHPGDSPPLDPADSRRREQAEVISDYSDCERHSKCDRWSESPKRQDDHPSHNRTGVDRSFKEDLPTCPVQDRPLKDGNSTLAIRTIFGTIIIALTMMVVLLGSRIPSAYLIAIKDEIASFPWAALQLLSVVHGSSQKDAFSIARSTATSRTYQSDSYTHRQSGTIPPLSSTAQTDVWCSTVGVPNFITITEPAKTIWETHRITVERPGETVTQMRESTVEMARETTTETRHSTITEIQYVPVTLTLSAANPFFTCTPCTLCTPCTNTCPGKVVRSSSPSASPSSWSNRNTIDRSLPSPPLEEPSSSMDPSSPAAFSTSAWYDWIINSGVPYTKYFSRVGLGLSLATKSTASGAPNSPQPSSGDKHSTSSRSGGPSSASTTPQSMTPFVQTEPLCPLPCTCTCPPSPYRPNHNPNPNSSPDTASILTTKDHAYSQHPHPGPNSIFKSTAQSYRQLDHHIYDRNITHNGWRVLDPDRYAYVAPGHWGWAPWLQKLIDIFRFEVDQLATSYYGV